MAELIDEQQKQGVSSKHIVLPDESQAAYERRLQLWIADYPPADRTGALLVEEACNAEWFLIRYQRRFNQAESRVQQEQGDAMNWTEEQHRRIGTFRRYLATAERQFARAFSTLEQRRGSRLRESHELERAHEKAERIRLTRERDAEARERKAKPAA